MHPTLIKIGPLPIHTYGLMIAIGFILSVSLMRRDARKAKLDPETIGDLAFWGLLVGLAGTRVAHIIMFPSDYSWTDPIGWIAIWRGGLVFQGALPPVFLLTWWYLRKHKMGFWKTADVVMPYIALGHAFGRIGCFMKGCCYGARTELPWGIRFPRVPWDFALPPTDSPAYLDHCQRYGLSYQTDHWSYPIHPTQLYSVIALLSLCALLLLLKKRWNPFEGFVFPVYMALYGGYRFLVEFLRDDHNPSHFAGTLSDQQVFSLISIVVGVALFLILAAKRKHDPAEAVAGPPKGL